MGSLQSGFYKWRSARDREPSRGQRRRTEIDAKVAAAQAASDGVLVHPGFAPDLGGVPTAV